MQNVEACYESIHLLLGIARPCTGSYRVSHKRQGVVVDLDALLSLPFCIRGMDVNMRVKIAQPTDVLPVALCVLESECLVGVKLVRL